MHISNLRRIGNFWIYTLGLILIGCKPEPTPPKNDVPPPLLSSEDIPALVQHPSTQPTPTPIPEPIFVPPQAPALINSAAWNLIVEFEVGTSNPSVYAKSHYRFPIWPAPGSGITWGFGYDAKHNTKTSILRSWSKLNGVERLAALAGKEGSRSLLTTVNDIVVPWDIAKEVFDEHTLPRFYQDMLRTFPGADQLCLDAQGALTSMVYNRGTSLVGDSRVDLRTIAKAVPKKDYRSIAAALRHMNITMGPQWKRQKTYAGLSRRRNAEADMVENCIK